MHTVQQDGHAEIHRRLQPDIGPKKCSTGPRQPQLRAHAGDARCSDCRIECTAAVANGAAVHTAGPATTVMPTPPRWLRENCLAKPTPLALRRRSCQISACSKALAELRTKDVGESENTYVANKSPTCCQHHPARLAQTVLTTRHG